MAEAKKAELLPFEDYDKVLVSLSAGKDSMACLFHLLNLGVDTEKIELWHQCVDGSMSNALNSWTGL